MKISREAKIGVFIIVSVSLFIWGFNYLKGINILKTSSNYFAIYEDINGLKEAAPIYLNGYKVGMVDKIYLANKKGSKITVEIAIKEKIDIPNNSTIYIFDDGFLGSKSINLIIGNSKRNLEYGDTINAGIEGNMMDEIKDQFTGMVEELDSITTIIQNILDDSSQTNIKNIISNIKVTTDAFSKSSAGLHNIITNIQILTNSISNNKDTIENILSNFSAISDSISDANISSTINNANLVLVQTKEIIGKINSGEGTAGLLINDTSLYNNLSNVANSMDSLLIDLKKNPKKYVHFSLFGGDKNKEKDK